MTAALNLAAEAGADGVPWLGPVITVVTLLVGSGGFVAWRRLSHDKRIGVAQQELAEDDALTERWKAIIETQTRVLLEPVTAELAALRVRFTALEGQLSESRRKYWSAIVHIRALNDWINKHLPDSVEQAPPPPATLAEDI
ncbi:membrane protein [Microbacterium phage Kozie]|uniref:Membrane protein n=1 Tax=Microbacterium phage Kozie TaxID=2885981 RepID=A0AAE8Y944_9CAUD|nr:membrane protein [Microbacterium phage Kozie]UDL16236.1 membrane protein [Microbacterium phage Kozie]